MGSQPASFSIKVTERMARAMPHIFLRFSEIIPPPFPFVYIIGIQLSQTS